MAVGDGVRLAPLHITKTAIRAGSSYLITNYTVQADQLKAWHNPDDTNIFGIAIANIEDAVSGVTKVAGFFETEIVFRWLSPGQVLYIDTLFSMSDTVQSALATYQTLTARGVWRTFNGRIHRAVENRDFKPILGANATSPLFDSVRYRFTNGLENTT